MCPFDNPGNEQVWECPFGNDRVTYFGKNQAFHLRNGNDHASLFGNDLVSCLGNDRISHLGNYQSLDWDHLRGNVPYFPPYHYSLGVSIEEWVEYLHRLFTEGHITQSYMYY